MPDAIAAASPPDEPPAVRVTSCGFAVAPNSGLTESHHIANSETFVLPSRIAPAAAHPRDRRAVRVLTWSASSFEPLGARMPATASGSLAVNGTPCSGPTSSPLASTASAATASSRASSSRGSTSALIRRVALGDPRRVRVDQLDRRDLALAHRARHPRRGALGEVGQVRNPASRSRASSES